MTQTQKHSWQTKKLGDICSFQNGFAFKSSEYEDSGFFVIRISNVQDGYISLTDQKFIQKNHKALEKFILKSGDILISLTGNVWRVGVVSEEHLPAVVNQRVARVSLKNKDLIQEQFLLYFLQSSSFKEVLIETGHGAAQQNISTKDIEALQIPLPPLPEQLRIVSILNETFEKLNQAKENIERNIQNAKDIFESYLQNIFTNSGEYWEEKKLWDVYDVRDGTHDSPKYQKDGYALITSKNLKNGKLEYKNIKYISETDYQKINDRSKVHKWDILFAMIGTIWNPVVIEIEPDFAIKNVALFKVPKDQNSYFLKYFLDSKFVVNKMVSEAKGTTQQFVWLGYLRNFNIRLPSLSEQLSIVSQLDTLSTETKRLETIYQQKLANLEELRKSILKKAFNGEL